MAVPWWDRCAHGWCRPCGCGGGDEGEGGWLELVCGVTATRSRGGRRRRVVRLNAADMALPDNTVVNTKYTWWSFIPRTIVDQFSAPMNLYFLLIAVLQLWRTITPVNPITTWAPLIVVCTITAVKEALDDMRRAVADAKANDRRYRVFRDGSEVGACRSADIRVGDLVVVRDDEEVPCDLVLLRTGAMGTDGVALIETANLDGETDLKKRVAVSWTQCQPSNAAVARLRGVIDADPPRHTTNLYALSATLTLTGVDGQAGDAGEDGSRLPLSLPIPLTDDQLVQHGTVVRKSGFVVGVAVYTGRDTRLNAAKAPPPTKVAQVDITLNRFVMAIFAFQLVLVLAFGLLGYLYSDGNAAHHGKGPGAWYLRFPADSMVVHGDHHDVLVSAADVDDPDFVAYMSEGGGGALHGHGDPTAPLPLPPGMRVGHAGTSGGGHAGRHLLSLLTTAVLHAGGAASSSSQVGAGLVYPPPPPWYTPIILPLRFLLLSSMMVPISLKVTLDLIKAYYAYSIGKDGRLREGDATHGVEREGHPAHPLGHHASPPAVANNTAIVEDLGKVTCVLTDKTGTLTDNVMALVAVSISGRKYVNPPTPAVGRDGVGGHSASGGGGASPADGGVPDHELMGDHVALDLALGRDDVIDFFRILALCNAVLPEQLNAVPTGASVGEARASASSATPALNPAMHHDVGGTTVARHRLVQYASSSPDEEALVHAAARLGIALAMRRTEVGGGGGSHQRVTIHVDGDRVGGAARLPLPAALPLPQLTPADLAHKRAWVSDHASMTTYTVLHELEFTSDRKCMSVILQRVDTGHPRESAPVAPGRGAAGPTSAFRRGGGLVAGGYHGTDSDEIVILTKGADEVMRRKLRAPEHDGEADVVAGTEAHLQEFSRAGLRTLLVAARTITPTEYYAWLPQLQRASIETHNRDAARAAAFAAMERDLVLLGCTAIEDRLQEGVPAAMHALRGAGVKVWMLTGDKGETAQQIATAAGLIPPPHPPSTALAPRQGLALPHQAASVVHPLRCIVRGDSEAVVESQLQAAQDALSAWQQWHGAVPSPTPARAADGDGMPLPPTVLVVEGIDTIRLCLGPVLRAQLARLAPRFTVVLCCRCLPGQKSDLVRLVRESGEITLAIGDGGNDVPMIQAAHVGVGLSGREGKQAARAADFTISRFRFVTELMLVHGRYAHYRTALAAQYTMYKSMCVCGVQMLYNVACAFSGCSLLDTFALTTYNLLYTFIPGILLAMDRDTPPHVCRSQPGLYAHSAGPFWLSGWTFFTWAAAALLHSILILFPSLLGVRLADLFGSSMEATAAGYTVFTCLVALQMYVVLVEMTRITPLHLFVNLGSLALYIGLMMVRNAWVWETTFPGTVTTMLASPAWLATMVWVLVVTGLTATARRPLAAWLNAGGCGPGGGGVGSGGSRPAGVEWEWEGGTSGDSSGDEEIPLVSTNGNGVPPSSGAWGRLASAARALCQCDYWGACLRRPGAARRKRRHSGQQHHRAGDGQGGNGGGGGAPGGGGGGGGGGGITSTRTSPHPPNLVASSSGGASSAMAGVDHGVERGAGGGGGAVTSMGDGVGDGVGPGRMVGPTTTALTTSATTAMTTTNPASSTVTYRYASATGGGTACGGVLVL